MVFEKIKSRLHLKKIQSQLMISNTILVIVTVVIIFLFFSYLFENLSIDTAYSITQEQVNRIANQMDALILQMDLAAKQVLFSDSIVEDFLDAQNEALFLPLENRRSISNALNSIIGPQYPYIKQINLIDCKNGNYIVAGKHSLETLISISELQNTDFIQKTIEKNGALYLSPLHMDKWSSSAENEIISVLRSFKNPSNLAVGIVEIPVSIQQIDSIFNSVVEDAPHIASMLLVADGSEIVYGHNCNEEDISTFLQIMYAGGTQQAIVNDKILCFTRLANANWDVLLAVDRSQIIHPIFSFRKNMLLFLSLSILFGIFLAYYISKKFSRPIADISASIQSMQETIGKSWPSELLSEDENELIQLNEAFQRLCTQLSASIQEAAIARSYEVESHLEALKARMNPHFLYNSLALIQSMAETRRNAEIVDICDDLSTMLRYILSKDDVSATLRTEFIHTCIYLRMMYRRFQDRFSYEIDLSPELSGFGVPKLIVQPLVENCFKHGFIFEGQWQISISGQRVPGGWTVSVLDNGAGFSADFLAEFASFRAQLDEQGASSLPITSRIGISSIYMRLQLAYGANAVFRLGNRAEGGAFITIGVVEGGEKDV